MEQFVNNLIDFGTNICGKIVLAIVAFVVGVLLIKLIKKLLGKAEKFSKLDKSVQSYLKSFISFALYALLLIIVIGILGIPMSSVIAVLASCALAIGLALQGALSNFAGGIMILIFKPFHVGDYIQASGAEGTVRSTSIFYTEIITVDNKRIMVPNGDLMGSNVTNFSSEELRRVDLDFKVTNEADQNFVRGLLMKAAEGTENVLGEPEPFARLSNVQEDTYIFTVRAWCKSEIYWDVYFALLENCSKILAENHIDNPEDRVAVRLVRED